MWKQPKYMKKTSHVAVPRRGASCYKKTTVANSTYRNSCCPPQGRELLLIVIITRGSHQINQSQNLQVLPPVAKLSVISYNVGIKTYIQNSRCQNRENGGIYMIFGYARVSTKTQARDGNSLDAQQAALTAAGAEKIYTDTFTGTKIERPEFDRLRAQLRKGDVLIVTRLDRLARSVSQASGLITEMIDEGVTINVLNLGILSNDSVNTLLRNVLLSFAQFERDMIVQRTQEGKAVARATDPNFREGRPPKFDTEQLDHAMALLEEHSYTQVVKLTGISKSTLIRERKRRTAL